MPMIRNVSGGTMRSSISLFTFIKRHWYLVGFLFFLLPSIITSIQIGIQTHNPTYPLFDLATRIFTADNVIDRDVALLKNDPSSLIGMLKPEQGIWKTIVFYWLFFWKVLYKMFGNVWFIFFPFVVIFKMLDKRNTSEKVKTFFLSLFFFLGYLFLMNIIILFHGVLVGNTFVNLPADTNLFSQYYYIIKLAIPFHGLISLVGYLISLLG